MKVSSPCRTLSSGTNRIALIQAALVPFALRVGGIRILPLPFDATPLVNALWWHPVHNRDSEHEWMRGLFKEAADIVAAAAPRKPLNASMPGR